VHEVLFAHVFAALNRLEGPRAFHFSGDQDMRQILVDQGGPGTVAKRDGGRNGGDSTHPGASATGHLVVDQALDRISRRFPRCAQIVEPAFFRDLDFKEIAGSWTFLFCDVDATGLRTSLAAREYGGDQKHEPQPWTRIGLRNSSIRFPELPPGERDPLSRVRHRRGPALRKEIRELLVADPPQTRKKFWQHSASTNQAMPIMPPIRRREKVGQYRS